MYVLFNESIVQMLGIVEVYKCSKRGCEVLVLISCGVTLFVSDRSVLYLSRFLYLYTSPTNSFSVRTPFYILYLSMYRFYNSFMKKSNSINFFFDIY